MVWEDTTFWLSYIKSHGRDIKDMLEYYLKNIPFVLQVNQIDTKKPLEIAW